MREVCPNNMSIGTVTLMRGAPDAARTDYAVQNLRPLSYDSPP